MIDLLEYSPAIDGSAVTVMMSWGQNGERRGRVMLPSVVRKLLSELAYPECREPMELEAAISYGLFIAMKGELSIRLSGDLSVWNQNWGMPAAMMVAN